MVEKETNPKVSVIVPNYNHSKYLNERIDSILNQTFQDFELIILDDKSPDNSVEVIESYRSHERMSHIVINEQNSGSTFKQWDKGFGLAAGEYIWIAESDDYADPTFLAKCVAALDSNDKAALAFTDSNFVDENGEKIECWIESLVIPENETGAVRHLGVDFVRDYLLFENNLYNASMILFRRSALDGISDYYRAFRGNGDWVFWVEMVLERELIHIPERLNSFRQHSNKVSSSMKNNNDRRWELASLILYIMNIYVSYSKSIGEDSSVLEQVKLDRCDTTRSLLNSFLLRSESKKIMGGMFTYIKTRSRLKVKLLGLLVIYGVKYEKSCNKHFLLGFIPCWIKRK